MPEEEKRNSRDTIIEDYLEIVRSKKSLPVYNDFLDRGISRANIRHHFGGIERLHADVSEKHSDLLQKYFSSVENIFSTDRKVERGHGTYIITTAVDNSPAHKGFIAALKSFCTLNSARLVIMPCESVTNSFENTKATFDPIFNDPEFSFVTEDIDLNANFSLCSIQVSAKQIKSITGLQRIGNREGSYVFASPKQFLEYIPSGNSRGKNYAIMTPGACTQPNYYSETYVSKRLSYIADFDHKIGAIIVSIIDERLFDFTQIQAETDGSFTHECITYKPDGTTHTEPVSIVFGDLHSAHVDLNTLEYFIAKYSNYNIDTIFLHDVFDGHSISHHIKDIAEKAVRSIIGLDSLKDELKLTFDLIKKIDDRLKPKKIIIVKSNHDEFLTRYLSSGGYIFDPKNHLTSVLIAPSLFYKDTDVLKYAFLITECDVPDNWEFLQRNDSYKIAGVECGSHGDLGLNGAKSSLNSLEKVYGNSITGHSHTAAIQRDVFRVGTLSKLDLKYNRGPSSWTQTCCLIYNRTGQRQLDNYIVSE